MPVRMFVCSLLILMWSFSLYAGTCTIVNGEAFGDCESVSVNAGPRGILVVTSSIHESGMIDGAVVKRGGMLKLSGMSVGGIVIEEGGALEVNGMVNGTVTNNGGVLKVNGTVSGMVTNNGGEVRVNGTVQAVHVNQGSLEVYGVVGSVTGKGEITLQKGAIVGGRQIR